METAAMVLALVALGLLAFVIMRNRQGEDVPEPVEEGDSHPRHLYHAVEIRPSGPACATARAFRGKRFLSSEAPPIPLPNCSQKQCSCVYVHYEDRRVGQRRDGYLHKAYKQGERMQERRQQGRRYTDRMLNLGH